MKRKLNEQSPSTADCGMLQSVMDPNIFDAICGAQCAGNADGFGNNLALLNIASCCECPEPPPTPPSAEDTGDMLCRRLMDDIIPNEYNSTGQEWCKKNCKDRYSIVMVDVEGKEVNGCKCCGRFNIDQVGPYQGPEEAMMSDWLTQDSLYTCEPGTTYAPSDDNIGTGDDAVFLNLQMEMFSSLPCYDNLQNYYNGPQQGNALNQYQEFPDGYPSQYAMWIAYGEGGNNWSNGGWPDDIICGQAQTYCDSQQGNSTNQPYNVPDSYPDPEYTGVINPWITDSHENFQNLCCEGTSTLVNDLNENRISESLVKRFKKLANIKK